jgi:hypothetical protein
VYLNISTTLYTGLRPNTVMASLRGSVTKLGVRFGENMDKRTVEKVLGAVAAILGSGSATSSEGSSGNGDGRSSSEGNEDKAGEGGSWRGLEELEVSFKTKVVLMPGMEEVCTTLSVFLFPFLYFFFCFQLAVLTLTPTLVSQTLYKTLQMTLPR